MQQTGTLKKRKKRNLAKVQGLGIVPYLEDDDLFDGTEMYTHRITHTSRLSRGLSCQSSDATRINISQPKSMYPVNIFGGMEKFTRARESISYEAKSGNTTRVTRDPGYHLQLEDDDITTGRKSSNQEFETRGAEKRHHFLDEASMNRLRMLLLLGACSGAFPWSWNRKLYRVDKWKPKLEKLWKIQWTFVTIQTFFLTGFQIYSFLERMSADNHTYREVFMMSLSTYWYVCAVYFNVNMYYYKEKIRNYINTLLEFNRSYVLKYVVDLEDYKDGGRLLINLSIPSNCSQVFASVGLFLVLHHKPWYLFSYLSPKPFYWLIPGAIQEFIVVGQVITSFMLTCWIVVAHTNSVEFWLRETHKNSDSDYTADELREPATALETYRALQVLCCCFNDCMSPLAIPLVKLHIFTGIIPCGYVLIRSMNQTFIDEFPGILTYPIGVIDCATAAFTMISMAAEMFDLAASFVDSWRRTKQKNLRRILMSFPTLRVKVGRFYFITVATTITFFQITFDYIIHCIITFQ